MKSHGGGLRAVAVAADAASRRSSGGERYGC